ncbi:Tetratrico peptide repeat-containing protein [Terribacillus aidingensis]|uniref:Tetratrico peptide repeat-containing protein n=1 Tax=Terribacillus aidingensis TaxID=586416 RepID=A0A285N0B2_9BACI|nr:tetratricopeptide repeat protein [Terribacillus aidingensis]SNZ02895.1 Tetratrico peptide repeat-containing protein [Terribacillus aidingensis]
MKELAEAIAKREAGNHTEANKQLVQLAAANPNHAETHYQCAWSFDVLGQERAAVPYYERAIALGLPAEKAEGAYLGLGSTYRALGEYEEAEKTLRNAITLFPENNALQVFYAMVQYNRKQHGEAMQILLKLLAETSSDEEVQIYQKAIRFYADNLDAVW